MDMWPKIEQLKFRSQKFNFVCVTFLVVLFVYLFNETGGSHDGFKTGLELLGLRDIPTSASGVVGIIVMCYHTQEFESWESNVFEPELPGAHSEQMVLE